MYQRSLFVARPLLLASSFFRALLEGGFAESQDLNHIDVTADSADALVLCLQILATGDAATLMPSGCCEILALMVEAHRLGFADAFRAAEHSLSKVIVESDVEVDALEAVTRMAKLYDLDRIVNECQRSKMERKRCSP